MEVLAVLSTPARVGRALSGRRLGGGWVGPQSQGGQGQVQIPLSWRVTASVHSEASATVICIGHHGSSQADPPVPCLLRAPVAKRPRSGCRQHGSPPWRGEGAAHLRSRASPRRAWPAGGGGTGASPPQSRAPGPPCRPGPPSRHRTVRGRRGHSLALPGCEFRGERREGGLCGARTHGIGAHVGDDVSFLLALASVWLRDDCKIDLECVLAIPADGLGPYDGHVRELEVLWDGAVSGWVWVTRSPPRGARVHRKTRPSRGHRARR